MVVYTKLDANGRFMADGNQPVLDFYWLMDGKNYKPVNEKIKKEIRERFTAQWSSKDRAALILNVNDLKVMKSDIKEPKMDVYARKAQDGMSVEAQMTLGPSDGNIRIKLSGIYTEGRAFPPSVDSVTLKGEQIVNESDPHIFEMLAKCNQRLGLLAKAEDNILLAIKSYDNLGDPEKAEKLRQSIKTL